MAQSEASAATSDAPNGTLPRPRAVLFIVFLGIVSLFGDMTYEGARSITGPYLGVLGVTATTIGIVAGFGELLGYGARLVSGYLGDRTGKYWAVTIAGYLLNLFAVPLLALAGAWQIAVVLIIAERMGRGIRSPVRDAMLSHAASRTGLGWGFGLHRRGRRTIGGERRPVRRQRLSGRLRVAPHPRCAVDGGAFGCPIPFSPAA
jgi:MFS family permease